MSTISLASNGAHLCDGRCGAGAKRITQARFGRPATLEHGLGCFVRVVRTLLGAAALADRKVECGLSLTALGVAISLHQCGYECRPSRAKMNKCIAVMVQALCTGMLSAGAASKLAGRLLWATQHLFHRLGRAMLRPIFKQKSSR